MHRIDTGSKSKAEMRFSMQIGQYEIDFFDQNPSTTFWSPWSKLFLVYSYRKITL
jgi:hypothetical protein